LSGGWLIVFAKAPRPGLVKTRLCPPLSLEESAAFYDAMLVDVLEASARFAAALGLTPVLAFHPPDGARELLDRAPPGYRLQVQRGADLGERMANAFAEAAAAGIDRILLRGSDSPALGQEIFATALDRLDRGDDVVLTPDQGGGYAVIGMRRPQSTLFEAPMSREDVLTRALDAARRDGLRVSTTTPGFDVDTMGDFRCFSALQNAQLLDLCPRTVESISHLPIGPVL
jgi:rSAM/selenodomain-associated transferase 1